MKMSERKSEARRKWFGHVQKHREYVGGRMLRTELPGRRKIRGVDIVGEEVGEKMMQGQGDNYC